MLPKNKNIKLDYRVSVVVWLSDSLSGDLPRCPQLATAYYYMAFQNSLFWLVEKRSVKTHIRTVVRIFRIWTGVPDVVYLAGSFKLGIVVFLDVSPLQTCVSLKFTDKNFKQPNCFRLSMHGYRILLPSETDDSRFNSREKHMLADSVQPYIINRLLTSLVRSVLWNIRPLIFAWTERRTKKPWSDISQYRPHARSISLYY